MTDRPPNAPRTKKRRVLAVFGAFLRLGLTSFGGPVAHLGYFRHEFVEKRKWVSETQFAQLVAICQFLPGPGSSQLGFSIGLLHAGWIGALAAFVAFTLPSALIMVALAVLLPDVSGPVAEAAVHGLKIVALAVVACGVSRMLPQLCPDWARRIIALLSVVLVLGVDSPLTQLLVVTFGAVAGAVFCRDVRPGRDADINTGYRMRAGLMSLAFFLILLIGLPVVALDHARVIDVADAFYRVGALVFGGGHVVLPLLEQAVVGNGWVSQDEFLAGYGASQAMPGPMFSFSAYLGFVYGGFPYALVALVSVFLPGFLLVAGVLPIWSWISRGTVAARVIAGVNASVVGLLAAALYDPIFVASVRGPVDLAIGAVALVVLLFFRVSPLWIVAGCVVARVAVEVAH